MRISDWSSDVCSSDLLVLGLAIGTFSRFYLVSWIGERVVADIRRQVFNHLVYLHPGFYENNRSSEIQSRLTADTTLLQSVIGSSLSLFLRNALMVIGGIVLLFITNPKLTSIVVIRSEEHTSELQSLMRISYAVFCLKKKTNKH